jgi:hypothetical protein
MDWSRRAVLGAMAALAGCGGGSTAPRPTGTPQIPVSPADATYAYTNLTPGGNRVLGGSGGSVADATPVEIPTGGTPAWLLAFDGGTGSYWTVVRRDGTATTHRVVEGTAETVADHGTVASPPVGYAADGSVGLLAAPSETGEHTHPIPLEDGLLYVATDGDVVVRRDETARLAVEAPADVRPVAVGPARYLVYGRRTGRYRHGALGDTTEPSSLVVVDADAGRIATETRLDTPLVFEGLAPLVADLDGDGDREVVTTVADTAGGARIRIYRPDGTAVATGPVHGSGWRHQLCVAPFAPDGRAELAVVRKPHVDRTVEFYRLEGGTLSVAATADGFASHTYGSRNLDGGLGADLDADGRTELLVPTTDRTRLAAIRRTDGGASRAWSLPLGGRLETNVAGVERDDGGLAVGAGTAETVRVWQG